MLEEKLGDKPLELLLVGHNPSMAAWKSGHYFSGPGNLFKRLAIASGLAEEGDCDDSMLDNRGIGFTDVCRLPNSDSSAISAREISEQVDDFYHRINIHANRVGALPKRVAFVGKRQFKLLFDPALKRVDHGLQINNPPGLLENVETWVLSSTSGRAVLSWADRLEPWSKLAEVMRTAYDARKIE